jgi:hypothetical protein
MNHDIPAVTFFQLLNARVAKCMSIEIDDRIVPVKRSTIQNLWIACRSASEVTANSLFEDHPKAQQPMQLTNGGRIELNLLVRERPNKSIEMVSYRIAFEDVPKNVNGLGSLRFELDCIGRGGDGWDDELMDNPEHPLSHFHVNYLDGDGANDCRLPAGPICPIVLLRSFDYWYRSCMK